MLKAKPALERQMLKLHAYRHMRIFVHIFWVGRLQVHAEIARRTAGRRTMVLLDSNHRCGP